MTKNIESLIKDDNGTSVQIGSSFSTKILSATGGVDIISIPERCVEVIFYPVTNNLKVSEISAMTDYDVVAKDAKESFPCSRMENVYVQGTASDVVYVRFTLI